MLVIVNRLDANCKVVIFIKKDLLREASIRKVNFGTDICFALLDSIREVDPSIYALDLFMKDPIERVKRFAVDRIRLLGAGK
ncbi:MAG: hypothetical protein IJP14_02640 [Clostridia bacterium]|nr:hypothetical protein [Clostridia bacterium]